MSNNKTITFLHMSKGFRGVKKNNKRLREKVPVPRDTMKDLFHSKEPLLTNSYYFSILHDMARRGYIANYILYMSQKWMDVFCKGRTICMVTVEKGFSVCYTSEYQSVNHKIKSSDLVMVRGNYHLWNPIIQIIDGNWIFLPCHGKISPENTTINLNKRVTVLTDDFEIRDRFIKKGHRSEVFRKPAMEIFYEKIPDTKKDLDIIFICSKTDRPHKRAGLFLNSLVELDKIIEHKVKVGLVGDSSAHSVQISSLNLKNINIERVGVDHAVGKPEVMSSLDRAKISICASNIDANPRVIVESLARNVPVLCAKDLAGGKFQIKKETGLFFNPNPKDLAKKIKYALNNLSMFSPRKNVLKISDASRQFIRLMR